MSRVAVVTGAARGIGAATVAALRAAGFETVGIDREAGRGTLAADLADPAAIAAAFAGIAARTGRIDALVNSAGIHVEQPLSEADPETLDRLLAVNIRAPILVAKAALPLLAPEARIVNVASELAYLGRAGAAAYAATKGAMLALTRSWARELAPIRVNAVAPGPTDTALLGFAAMSSAEQALETANPLGRIGRPEEIAAVIAFLCGEGAGFVTGQCFSADGGAAMH